MRQLDGYMARRYRKGPQAIVHRREMALLERLLQDAGGSFSRILDCPCGHGRLTEPLRERSDCLVSADVSVKTVKAHTRYFGDKGVRLLDAACDISSLPFPDGVFDGMVIFRLFHHLVDPEMRKAAFQEAARVTRSFLLISYYGVNPLHELTRKLNRKASVRRGKKAFLAQGTLEAEAALAGWRYCSGGKPLPFIHAQRVALFRKSDRG